MLKRLFLLDPNPPVEGGGGTAPSAPAAPSTPAPASQTQNPEPRNDPTGVPKGAEGMVFKALEDLDGFGADPALEKIQTSQQPLGGSQTAGVQNQPNSQQVSPLAQVTIPSAQTPPAAPSVVPAVPAPAIPQVTLPEQPRDYNGYDAEAQGFLKQMSNPAFNWVNKQLKEAEKKASNTFLQHPQAYLLSTDYQKLNEDAHYLRQEYAHLTTALESIVEGKPWQPLKGFDAAGNPVAEAPRTPTTMDAEHVRMRLAAIQQAYGNVEGKMNNYSATYKQQIAAGEAAIAQTRATMFSWAANPTGMEQTVKFNGQDAKVKDVHQHIIKMLPPHMQNLPNTPIIGDLFVWNTLLRNEIDALKASGNIQQTKIAEAGKVEPSSARGVLPAAPSKFGPGVPAVFTTKGMEDL